MVSVAFPAAWRAISLEPATWAIQTLVNSGTLSARRLGLLALGLGGCASGSSAEAPAPSPAAVRWIADRDPDESVARDADPERALEAPLEAGAPCLDELPPGAVARLSCDGAAILVAGAVVFHPMRRVAPPEERSNLAAVAEVMRDHSEILLVQIEVFTGDDPGREPDSVRRAFRHTQQRADALFRQLWLRERISAERLEPVGRGYGIGSPEGFTARFRVVQRRTDVDPAAQSQP